MTVRAGTLPAVFMRGGTSKALMLRRSDLPGAIADWATVFLSAMGIARDTDEAARVTHAPFIGLIAPPAGAPTLSGERIETEEVDLTARVISNGIPHETLPLTATLCLAVAARIESSLVHEAAVPAGEGALRVGMPSGVLTADAAVSHDGSGRCAERDSFFRTARRLMRGEVYYDGTAPA